jgi:hypothetical protein
MMHHESNSGQDCGNSGALNQAQARMTRMAGYFQLQSRDGKTESFFPLAGLFDMI